MMGVVLAPNLLQLFICWELVGVCSYLLIGFWYRKPEAARAALKAFWTTKAGDVGLLIGIVLLQRATGTFDFVELRQMAETRADSARRARRHHVLHLSRRDGEVGAVPAARLAAGRDGRADAGLRADSRGDDGDGGRVSADAARVSVRADAGRAGDRRVDRRAHGAAWRPILACVQTDIKRVLAYSTVSQLGYMMTAIGAGFAARRVPAPADARRLQGAAVPRRRRGHPRRPQQRHDGDGRPRAEDAADGDRLSDRHAVAGGRAAVRRLRRRRKKSSARCGPADSTVPFFMLLIGRVPDRLLHVPRRVPGVLR